MHEPTLDNYYRYANLVKAGCEVLPPQYSADDLSEAVVDYIKDLTSLLLLIKSHGTEKVWGISTENGKVTIHIVDLKSSDPKTTLATTTVPVPITLPLKLALKITGTILRQCAYAVQPEPNLTNH